MNYRDFINFPMNEHPIAFIKDTKENDIYIYNFLDVENKVNAIASLGINGVKELYPVKTKDNEDFIIFNHHSYFLKDAELNFIVVGKIKDNKVFPQNFRQGCIYKNEITFYKTLNLKEDELKKLPLNDQICYIPEYAFEKEYIDLSDSNLVDGKDYFTVNEIRKEIMNYYQEGIERLTKKDMNNLLIDLYDCLDWQYPLSLISEGYLDDFFEDKNIEI